MVDYKEYDDLAAKYDLDIIKYYPEILYHYTDVNALMNIILNKSIWVSNSLFLNDKKEIFYFDSLINDSCELLRTINPHALLPEFKEIFLSENILSEKMGNLPHVYTLSLTTNPDNHLLWSYYSNNDGYNFGINFRDLQEYISTKVNDNSFNSYYGPVIYDTVTQHNTIAREINSYFHEWLQIKDRHSQKVIELFQRVLFYRFCMYALFFKDPFFKFEEEYRVIFVLNKNQAKEQIKFRNKKGAIIPYIDSLLSFNKHSLPLKSVNIGPKNNIDISMAGLRLFLDSVGFENVVINKSQGPLRF